MKINKAHCLFEQSGTFKNEFIKLGIPAEDYDICNDYGNTDHQIDLFEEIRGGYEGKPSIFDDMKPDDVVLAFFPCTRFSTKIYLSLRGEAYQHRNWSLKDKLVYSMGIHRETHRNYELISQLAWIALDRRLQLIIENPYTQPHYLTQFWCIKPSVIDMDRRENGDYMTKPTQFFFIGCEPKDNFIFEALDYVEPRVIDRVKAIDTRSREEVRSEIHPQYANRFIRRYILDADQTQHRH